MAPETPKQNQSLNLKVAWTETPSKDGAKATVVANVSFTLNGRQWHSTIAGTGADLKAAVADLAVQRMHTAIQVPLRALIAKKLLGGSTKKANKKPEAPADPKEPTTPATPAPEGQTTTPAGSTQPGSPDTPPPQTGTQLPSSGQEPSTPTPKARSRQRNSATPAGTEPA